MTKQKLEADPTRAARLEQNYQRAVPDDVREKVKRIEDEFRRRNYGADGIEELGTLGVTTPEEWETVGQTGVKLKVVASEPETYDKDGSKLERYVKLVRSFNLKTGKFEELS